MLCITSEL